MSTQDVVIVFLSFLLIISEWRNRELEKENKNLKEKFEEE